MESPNSKRTRVTHDRDHDPVPFECPCGSCEYDCQKRAPVRSACTCRRLLCRKCAGVAASLPDPAPCGLCGAASVGPFEEKAFAVDRGVLLALASRLAPRQPYVLQDACLCVRFCAGWLSRDGVLRLVDVQATSVCGLCAGW